MTTSFLPKDVAYDRDVHFNSSWADLVIRKQFMLFEAPGEPLRTSHLEDWYNSYLWFHIIDNCMLDLPGMALERGGPTNRQKIGARLDGVFRSVEDGFYEYGGIEVVRSFNGETSTKWLSDSLKLVKVLRDMLGRLHALVEHKEVAGRLQVVGVFNVWLSFQLVRLCSPRGYVSVLQREKRQEVPGAVGEMKKLLHLLMAVAQMKRIVRDCAAVVDERYGAEIRRRMF